MTFYRLLFVLLTTVFKMFPEFKKPHNISHDACSVAVFTRSGDSVDRNIAQYLSPTRYWSLILWLPPSPGRKAFFSYLVWSPHPVSLSLSSLSAGFYINIFLQTTVYFCFVIGTTTLLSLFYFCNQRILLLHFSLLPTFSRMSALFSKYRITVVLFWIVCMVY
jgi:hypothetical protein